MSFTFTTRLPLSRHAVDRDHIERTTPGLLDELWADTSTRVLVLWHGRTLLTTPLPEGETVASGRPRLALVAAHRIPADALRVYLGRSLADDELEPAGTRLAAVVLTDEQAASLEPNEALWVGLRTIVTDLSDRDAGLFTEALGVLNWHDSHSHCPRCGTQTSPQDGGWVRRCPSCGNQVFPRTDPAVIVLITDAQDRMLLGSNALWENNRYSLLAGFVEPGEPLEAAVVREMLEESGLRVTRPEYLGSQPWPFPASIMCGFTARLADDQRADDLVPDGQEILDLRWFTRQELRDASDWLILPGASSIAHAMIEQWLTGVPSGALAPKP
ncbi:NAD(+) diphosphatase [Cryobacterium psychrophilum]|uniref:NAD(+) diphosphatase n=1 Tax=Cryobacterium psychrophilum TaxID=41988 RepID=A0A4Y8KRB8_9MICO|nr:NAD(+) diphosphatase [Cryobacterium psychrophilum]TDW30924.1 NAD+ diphosphatase [Cryobacterium psychrophilum]TFD80799.1 NAD(+) diphosphatase [Cryobacterium psychrophilum]